MDLIGWIILGFVAGSISGWFVGDRTAKGCLPTIVVGMVGGVIGGLAEYFERDVTLLRVLYVLISVASVAFPGIFVYLILWVIVPLRRPGEP